MASLSWIKLVMYLVVVWSVTQNQATDEEGTTPSAQPLTKLKRPTYGNCSCTDQQGKIYNLARLGRTNGRPRFHASAKNGYRFAYNPCFSFSKGSFGDCSGDVAMCMWTNSSFQDIGDQSTMTCGFDEHNTPQLEYGNRNFPGWKVIVNLHCDHKRTSIKSAKFKVKTDLRNPMRFLLTHSCACPDGCLDHSSTTRPSVPPIPHGWKDVGVPVCIAAAGVAFVIIVVVVIWRWINRDNDRRVNGRRNSEERRPILDGDRINNDPNEGRSSSSPSHPVSRDDNRTFSKNFNEV